MEFVNYMFLVSFFSIMGLLLESGVANYAERSVDGVGVEAKQARAQDLSLRSAPAPDTSAAPRAVGLCDLGEELYVAAWQGELEEVMRLLDYGADPNYKNADGRTPLYESARFGHAPVVNLLLQRRANVDSKITDGWTALHAAAEFDRSGVIVSLLMSKGASTNIRSDSQETPLHRAAYTDNDVAAWLLVEGGASKTVKNSDGTLPIAYALSEGLFSLLKPNE